MDGRTPASARHVLIVDDHEEVRNGLQRYLRVAGMLVTCVDSGAAALELLSQTTPDLVLLDIWMRDIDGFEVLRRIRADARTAHLPVVMLSADADEDLRERSCAAGANDYLIKAHSDLTDLPMRLSAHMRSEG